jgi:predicted transcriptional regulator YdeE
MGAKLIKFEVIDFPETRIIGKSITVSMDTGADDHIIEDLWKDMSNNGNFDFLFNLPNKITEKHDSVGWQGDFNPGDKEYTYFAGVFFSPKNSVPNGYEYRDIIKCKMAVGWLEGTPDGEGDIHMDASSIIQEAMKENGYEYNGQNGFFEMEYYSEERFRNPEKQGKNVILDFYSPCKKKE